MANMVGMATVTTYSDHYLELNDHSQPHGLYFEKYIMFAHYYVIQKFV